MQWAFEVCGCELHKTEAAKHHRGHAVFSVVKIFYIVLAAVAGIIAFSALTMVVGQQEEYTTCRN